MGQRRLGGWDRRVLVGFLAVAAMGTALLAPLATSSGQAGAVTIDGARSLADKVSVQFQKAQGPHHRRAPPRVERLPRQPRGRRRPQHLRPVRRRRRLAGQGGARQAGAVRRQADQRHRRRQHRRQPARRRPLLRRAVDDRHQPDERRLRVGRQPRVRQGLGPSCCGSRTAAAAPTSVAPRRPTRWPAAAPPTPIPAPTSSTCRPTSCATTTGKTLFPAFGTKRIKSDSGKKFEIGIIGEVLEATPTIVTPTGVAGLDLPGRGRRRQPRRWSSSRSKGVNTSVLVIHQGGFQSGTATLNGCAGNLAGSDIAEIATRLDPSIKVIVSAHTHAEYRCTITTPDGVTRLITSASSFGRILTDITLTIDDKSGELVAASADELDRAQLEQPEDTRPPTCRCSTCPRTSGWPTWCSSTSPPRRRSPTRSSARSARTSSTPPNAARRDPVG